MALKDLLERLEEDKMTNFLIEAVREGAREDKGTVTGMLARFNAATDGQHDYLTDGSISRPT